MDTNTSTFLAQAFAQAPVHIKTFIASGKYERFLERLQAAQNFHLDVLDNVSDEILMMLVGMAEPQELPVNLQKEAGLTEAETAAVIALANQEVFTPLREEMKKQATTPPAPPVPPRQPLIPVPAPLPEVKPVESQQPISSIPVPPPTPAPTVEPAPIQPMPQFEPTMRTMAHDIEVMKDGHASESTRAVPQPQISSVPSTPPAVPVDRPVPPPAPVPRVSLDPKLSAPVEPPATPRVRTPDATELTSTLKKYGIDPYREPTE